MERIMNVGKIIDKRLFPLQLMERECVIGDFPPSTGSITLSHVQKQCVNQLNSVLGTPRMCLNNFHDTGLLFQLFFIPSLGSPSPVSHVLQSC